MNWNKKWIKLKNKIWFRFVIKGNEFHKSLDYDHTKVIGKSKEERKEYEYKLMKKRNLAHQMSNPIDEW